MKKLFINIADGILSVAVVVFLIVFSIVGIIPLPIDYIKYKASPVCKMDRRKYSFTDNLRSPSVGLLLFIRQIDRVIFL